MIDNLLKIGGAPEGYDASLIVKEFEKKNEEYKQKQLTEEAPY